MSVHVIYYQDGAKMMRPVHTREEYIALRDSEQNRRADKQHMVQMAYSCLPNEDGTLKGSTRLSTTIGADIDVPIDTDFVLSKKEELGLLMFENSATKQGCGHVVCRRNPELTQEGNLRRISDILGVEYDKAAKDITRVFYTPADKLVYLDDEIFNIEEAPAVKTLENPQDKLKRGSGTDNSLSQQKVGETPTKGAAPAVPAQAGEQAPASGSLEKASEFALKAFDLCVKEAGLDVDTMDVWGEHNWHTNLMAVLSVGLPKLMSKEQLLAVVREKLPNYSLTEDCQKLIEYFYKNYTADKGFMSSSLRSINVEAQKFGEKLTSRTGPDVSENLEKKEGEGEEDDGDDKFFQNFNPPKAPGKLTRLQELLVKNYDARFRDQILLGAQVALAGMSDHFRCEQIDGDVTTGATDVVVLGLSGSGKKNITDCFHLMVKNTIQASDDLEWAKMRENTELREQKKNAKDCPKKYHPAIRIFSKASTSSLQEMQTNLGEGMSIGVYSEGDTLVRASNAAWSDLSTYFRVGWDHDKQPQLYMNDSSCNSNTELSISLLCLGTPKVILSGLMKDSNVENGLLQRCQIVPMPTQISFRAPKKNLLSSDEKRELDGLLLQLWQKNMALGDGTLIIETPKMHKVVDKFYSRLEEKYNEGLLTKAEAQLSHRIGNFMIRAALPLVILYGSETPEIMAYAQWVGEYAYYTTCFLFGRRVQDAINESSKMMNVSQDARKTAQPILVAMPDIFNIKQFKEARVQAGQSEDCKSLLHTYVKQGRLERIGRGVYRKCQK